MKMNPSGDTTHRARAMDPAAFRAQATGIGMTVAASRATGGSRAQRVVDQTDPACMSVVPEAEGYPSRSEFADVLGTTGALSYNGSGRGKLR
jgi:hypothetical protein